jgi:hypothetical protein
MARKIMAGRIGNGWLMNRASRILLTLAVYARAIRLAEQQAEEYQLKRLDGSIELDAA